jgi:hypothetical protein
VSHFLVWVNVCLKQRIKYKAMGLGYGTITKQLRNNQYQDQSLHSSMHPKIHRITAHHDQYNQQSNTNNINNIDNDNVNTKKIITE